MNYHPLIILGCYGSGVDYIAGIAHYLGIDMGTGIENEFVDPKIPNFTNYVFKDTLSYFNKE